jgi:hypothetical protein
MSGGKDVGVEVGVIDVQAAEVRLAEVFIIDVIDRAAFASVGGFQ